MASRIDLLARLLAFEAGQVQPIATHRQVAIRSDALVIAPIAMAGEDTTIHAVAIGTIGQPGEVLCVADPRIRDDQYRLFATLGERAEAYFADRRAEGSYPQLWVSSTAAASHLDTLADRLRYNQQNAPVRRFGELLSYATERFPIAGQQALQTATQALGTHWVTGQQDGEDEHLGALLAWIDPPPGVHVLDAVALAEREPMGIKTDPVFDQDVLAPLVQAYNEARRAGASQTELAYRVDTIRRELAPIVLRIYEATQRAITILLAANLPPLADLAAIEVREARAFSGFMTSRDQGYPLPLRDRPKAAAFKLTAREDAVENIEAAIRAGDHVGRARARLAGEILLGEVVNVERVRLGPRRFELRFELLSQQRILKIRQRDELCWIDDPRLRVTVTEVQRIGRASRISLVITAGQRAVGLPIPGTLVELVPNLPNWGQLPLTYKHLKERLAVLPWTHADGDVPPARARSSSPPADLIGAVEALR